MIVDCLLKVASDKGSELNCDAIEPLLAKLCQSVGAENTFRTVSQLVRGYKSPEFIFEMLGLLTRFLVTSPVLEGVRLHLRENREYFESVFENWAFEVSSAVTLCLIGEQYVLARQILSLYESRPITESAQL
jgi:hypothetical protein